jgi:hypothetical protein
MPSLNHTENFETQGGRANCEYFDRLYCEGRIVGNYSCGNDSMMSRTDPRI